MKHIQLNTLYYYCNDVVPIRHFYVELLGLQETFYRNDDEVGWLTMQIGATNVVFVQAEKPLPVPEAFAKQLGYAGGTIEVHSWVLEVGETDFDKIIERLQDAGVPCLAEKAISSRPGIRQFVVRDPAGFTIELYVSTA